jgi:hypothetical protein
MTTYPLSTEWNIADVLANARDLQVVPQFGCLDEKNRIWFDRRGTMRGGTFIIKQYDTPYRTADPPNGVNFSALSSADYEPLAIRMRALTPLVGEQRAVRVDALQHHKWEAQNADSLDEALERFRFGSLDYSGKDGGVYFTSNAPECRTGILRVHFRYDRFDELNEKTLMAAEQVLRDCN